MLFHKAARAAPPSGGDLDRRLLGCVGVSEASADPVFTTFGSDSAWLNSTLENTFTKVFGYKVREGGCGASGDWEVGIV